MKKFFLSIVPVLFALMTGNAHAYTECTYTLTKLWTGDAGMVFMVPSAGPWFYVVAGNPDTPNILASARLAVLTGATVVVRFNADGVACASAGSNRSDVAGMWLMSN